MQPSRKHIPPWQFQCRPWRELAVTCKVGLDLEAHEVLSTDQWCKQGEKNGVVFRSSSIGDLELFGRMSIRYSWSHIGRSRTAKKDNPWRWSTDRSTPQSTRLGWDICKGHYCCIVIFTGTLTATRYTDILDKALVPFVMQNYPVEHRFQQVNDPKHTQSDSA